MDLMGCLEEMRLCDGSQLPRPPAEDASPRQPSSFLPRPSPLMFSCIFCPAENVPARNSDVDYRLLEAAKAGDLDTVKVIRLLLSLPVFCSINSQQPNAAGREEKRLRRVVFPLGNCGFSSMTPNRAAKGGSNVCKTSVRSMLEQLQHQFV